MATFDSIPPEEESEEDIAAKFSKACDVCGKLYPHHDTTAHLLKAPEAAKQGLVFLLTRIASWTNARWDQHLRERYGDKATDEIIEWLHKHEIYAPGPTHYDISRARYECSNCGATNTERSGPCAGCKLTSPPRKAVADVADTDSTWEQACKLLEARPRDMTREELAAIREVVYRVRLFSAALTWLEENIPSGIQLVARALVHGEAGARR
jgi:hypothetical protein